MNNALPNVSDYLLDLGLWADYAPPAHLAPAILAYEDLNTLGAFALSFLAETGSFGAIKPTSTPPITKEFLA